jgi:hypothetical protein
MKFKIVSIFGEELSCSVAMYSGRFLHQPKYFLIVKKLLLLFGKSISKPKYYYFAIFFSQNVQFFFTKMSFENL